MNGIYRNRDGYLDQTAGKAIENAIREENRKKYRPLVYIVSRYAGDVESNVNDARRYCRFAVDNGYIPLASHLIYPQFMNDADEGERELGLFFGKVLMDKCSEVWVFGEDFSEGMKSEYDRAVRKNMMVRHFDEECRLLGEVVTCR